MPPTIQEKVIHFAACGQQVFHSQCIQIVVWFYLTQNYNTTLLTTVPLATVCGNCNYGLHVKLSECLFSNYSESSLIRTLANPMVEMTVLLEYLSVGVCSIRVFVSKCMFY